MEFYKYDWERIARLVKYERAREEEDEQPILAAGWDELHKKVLHQLAMTKS